MDIREQLAMCSRHYKKWKGMALSEGDREASKKFMERAFFWLELQSAFMALWAVEKTAPSDQRTKNQIIAAKANLSKKLADYAKGILDDMEFRTPLGGSKFSKF